MTNTDLTNGRWPDLLMQLAGLTPDQLTDKHQPCPLCGGEDRYRFDDLNGTGSWYCNQCGGKDQSGGAGSGISINSASVSELEDLPGVGPVIAARIVSYREANGPFTSIDGLGEVSGIGDSIMGSVRDIATL